MMHEYLTPPWLAATFTPQGRRLKSRLEHIFSQQGKKRGFFLPVLVLTLLACGTLVACVPQGSVMEAETAEATEHGTKITTPDGSVVTVASPITEESPEKVRDRCYPELQEGLDAVGYVSPLEGANLTVLHQYGTREHPVTGEAISHDGVDLKAEQDDPVYAVAAGTVEQAGFDEVYGNHVILRHADGNTSMYAHLSGYVVSPGDTVAQKQNIGSVGQTGMATGAHLHLELRDPNNMTLDPMAVLE